jgi:hypothetical protein
VTSDHAPCEAPPSALKGRQVPAELPSGPPCCRRGPSAAQHRTPPFESQTEAPDIARPPRGRSARESRRTPSAPRPPSRTSPCAPPCSSSPCPPFRTNSDPQRSAVMPSYFNNSFNFFTIDFIYIYIT